MVRAVLYRLKTGCQWRLMPVAMFFKAKGKLSWQGVYYHFRRRVRDGSFKKGWVALLKNHHRKPDVSSLQSEGSHTLAKNGGQHSGYQGRKKARTTKGLFLCDKEGLRLAVATPQSGQHHEAGNRQERFDERCAVWTQAGLDLEGIFVKADSGFDCKVFQTPCEQKAIQANMDRKERAQKEQIQYRYL